MSVLLSAAGVAEQALIKIGAFSVNDSAADGEQLKRALSWLDFIMAHHFGTQRVFFLIPDTLSVPLAATVTETDIETALGADAPDDGIQFPVGAKLKDSDDNETSLKIITREEYIDIDDKDATGTPECIYIDRLNSPKLFTYPTLGAGATGYTVELTVQTFAPDVHGTPGGQATSMREAWQLWAITELAARIGAGPVRRLPISEIEDMRKEAKDLKDDLYIFENRQHASTSGRVAFRDF